MIKSRKCRLIILGILSTIFTICWNTSSSLGQSGAPPLVPDGSQIYSQASQSVVTVVAGNANGSGFIVSTDGLIVTNRHVVENLETNLVRIVFNDGTEGRGRILALGTGDLDLAALEIQQIATLPVIPFANANSIQVGQEVYAIGNPFGQFPGTFTKGIVSRLENGWIQHDASINSGNSGGPLLNRSGELIGVNTAIYTTDNGGNIGISLAIHLSLLEPFLAEVKPGFAAPRTNPNPLPTPNPLPEVAPPPPTAPNPGGLPPLW